MNDEKKPLIISALNHLTKRDPDWAHVKMLPKFKVLYGGWAARSLRQGKHNKYYYSRKWREGWLPMVEFISFLNYVME